MIKANWSRKRGLVPTVEWSKALPLTVRTLTPLTEHVRKLPVNWGGGGGGVDRGFRWQYPIAYNWLVTTRPQYSRENVDKRIQITAVRRT